MSARQAVVTLAFALAFTTACFARARAAESCSFTAASGVNFGNYDVLSAAQTLSNGTLTYLCTGFPPGGERITITLSRGNAPTYTPRFMLNGLQQLNYNLYLDAALTMIWGNGGRGTRPYGPVGVVNGVPVTVTMFGQIPVGQDVTAGGYTDTITATINF